MGMDEAGVSATRATIHRHLQERGNNCCIHIKPVLNDSLSQKCLPTKDENNWIAGEALYSDESQFCISFRNQGPKVWWSERHRIQCVLSLEWIFHCLWWFAMPCHLPVLVAVGLLCFKTQRQCSYQEILEHFILQAVWRCTLTFSAGLSTCPVCQTYFHMVSWPCYYYACLASYLTWPASHR